MTSRIRRAVAGSVVVGAVLLSIIAGTLWSVDGNWWGAEQRRDPRDASVSSDISREDADWRGQVAIGGGSSTSCLVLGELLRQTLIERGYRVIDLVGMETPERIRQALADADVDLVWCNTPPELASQNGNGLADVVVVPTFVLDGWRLVVSEALAAQLPELTISALARVCEAAGSQIRFAAASPAPAHILGLLQLEDVANLCIDGETPVLPLAEVETRLKLTRIDLAVVPRLEETLTVAGFVPLDDDRGVMPQDAVQIVVQRSLLEQYPEIGSMLLSLGERVTTEIVHHLVTQVRLLRRSVEDVVREFLASSQPSA